MLPTKFPVLAYPQWFELTDPLKKCSNTLQLLDVYLALATHSIVTSEVPVTTLVFLGGMMIVGAIGSAGPPTSKQIATHKHQDTHTHTCRG